MPATTLKRGDRVVAANDPRVPSQVRGRVFIVERVNPKKAVCRPESGVDRGINFPHDLLVPATDDNVAASTRVEPIPFVHYEVGAIVTLKQAWRDWTVDTPLVVVGGRDRVNVTLLGGAGDRYLRCSRDGLILRDVDWLADQLVEQVTSCR